LRQCQFAEVVKP